MNVSAAAAERRSSGAASLTCSPTGERAELHGRAAQSRLQAMETGQAATEAAVTAVVQILGPRTASVATIPASSGVALELLS